MNQSYAPPQQATPTPAQTPATQTATPDQDTHGNSYMAQGFGSGLADWIPDLGDLFGTTPEEQARQEQEDFLNATWPPLADFDTGTGGVFDADLMGDELLITLKVAFNFVPGSAADAPVGVTAAELQWTQEQQDEFRANYASVVEGTWSHVHEIRSTLPLWTTTVKVAIMVIEDPLDPHFTITVAKFPPDAGDNAASVCDGGYHHGPGGGCDPNPAGDESGTAIIDSRDNDPARVRLGSQSVVGVWFERGSAVLDQAAQDALDAPVQSLVDNPAWTVELIGRSSAEGEATSNLNLARDRTEAVSAEITSRGVASDRQLVDNKGEEGAARNDEFDRRVDVQVVDVQNQVTSAHETGHMFGLFDEYPTTGESAGDPLNADYQQLIADNVELPPGGMPTKGNTDSIMSNGMQVETWHYAPFVAALKAVTGSQDWIV